VYSNFIFKSSFIDWFLNTPYW